MRIVAFWDNHKGVARRNQLELIERLDDHCDLAIYGPGSTGDVDRDLRLKPLPYNKEFTANDIIKRLNPDCFYLHFNERVSKWIPKGFEDIKIPKIMHDRNYYKIKEGWYDSMNFDLIIQCQADLDHLCKNAPTVFLPLSASEREFKDMELKRNRKV